MKNRIKSFSQYIGSSLISENLQYHISNSISIVETVFRPGSVSHIELLNEARSLYKSGELQLSGDDAFLFDTEEVFLQRQSRRLE